MKCPLNISRSVLNIGIEHPIRLLHITDSHLTCHDAGLDSGRAELFSKEYNGDHVDYFTEAVEYAKANGLTVLHTGDLMDFVSDENLALLKKSFSDVEYLYVMGNHDFCMCAGEPSESYEMKKARAEKTPPYSSTNAYFDHKTVGGVNFVSLSNVDYRISEEQLALIKKETEKGLPIVLLMHIPFFTPEHADAVLATGLPCAYISCASQEYLSRYSEADRKSQEPNAQTLKALEYIRSAPLIKAVIAGHTHVNREEDIGNGVIQIATAACYAGYVREITIV